MKTVYVIEGDSSDGQIIKHKINGALISDYSGYTCDINVIDSVKKETKLTKNISFDPNTGGFNVILTPTETKTLGKGEYIVVVNLSKIEDGEKIFNRQTPFILHIKPSYISD